VTTAIGIALAVCALGTGCTSDNGNGNGETSGSDVATTPTSKRGRPGLVGLRGRWDVTASVTDTYTDGDPIGATLSDVWTILDSCVSTRCRFTSDVRARDFDEDITQPITRWKGEYSLNLKTAIECTGPNNEIIASLVGQVYDTYHFRPTHRDGNRVTEMAGTVQSRVVADTFTCPVPDDRGTATLVLRRRARG
jgi:hypothetical protein